MEKWEYITMVIWADINGTGVKDAIAKKYPGWKPSKYSPHLMEPELDNLGYQGWELVSMQPVLGVGNNADILMDEPVTFTYSNAYFCAFKRRKEG